MPGWPVLNLRESFPHTLRRCENRYLVLEHDWCVLVDFHMGCDSEGRVYLAEEPVEMGGLILTG
jgi:hypothetical protein